MSEQTSTMPPLPPLPPPPGGRRDDGDDGSNGRSRRQRDPNGPAWYRTPVARDPDSGRIAGVVAGLSRSFQVDLRSTRIATVLITFVFPVTILAYLALWFLLPNRPEQAMPIEDVVRDRRRIPLLIAIAIVILAGGIGSLGSWFFFGGFPWGLGLIAIGVLLWAWPDLLHRDGATPPPPPAPGAPLGATFPRETAGDPTASDAVPGTAWAAPTSPAASSWTESTASTLPPVVRRPRRKRYPVRQFGFLATIGTAFVMIVGHRFDWWPTTVLGVVTTIACMLFATALVDGIVNRRWLAIPSSVWFGAIASFLLVVQPNLNGGVGERTLRPATAEAAAAPMHLAIGKFDVDLTALPAGTAAAPSNLSADASLGMGRLHVTVPWSVNLVIDAEVGAGHVVLDGHELTSGVRTSDHWVESPPSNVTATGTLHLTLKVGAGEIAVDRVAP